MARAADELHAPVGERESLLRGCNLAKDKAAEVRDVLQLR